MSVQQVVHTTTSDDPRPPEDRAHSKKKIVELPVSSCRSLWGSKTLPRSACQGADRRCARAAWEDVDVVR